ncbi:MAG: hypothetical protein DBX47_01580 [Clostridiales bacterium]|nr:MAG: hypothetical protein DBX47_01580 [Clostridiales bacterium]
MTVWLNYDKIVSDGTAEIKTLSNYAYKIDGFQSTYAKLNALIVQIEDQAKSISKTYDENRNLYASKQADVFW